MSALALESTRRLAELLRREHAALGDFLVALADFDRQRLWEPLGHTGLFYFLHRELGLSKGAAHYRKVAAGLVQRFPEVVAPLRDGRLCITSVVELARVMTEENRAEVLPYVSALGGVAAAFTAALLIRTLPATIAMARPDDTERVMVRANAWASVASISAPLAIGATIAIGFGWLPGMAVPLGIGAVAVLLTAKPEPHETVTPVHAHHDGEVVPPFATWWREITVLSMCITVEFCFAYFAATYLHDEIGLSTAGAAAGAAAWGIGMTVGRFVVSVRPAPRSILPSVALIGIGFALLWGVGEPAAAIAGIGLAGLGAAPLYPTRVTALMARFPASPDQGATRGGVASGIALVGAPALMAGLRELTDVRTAYLAVPVLLLLLAVLAKPVAAPRGAPALAS